VTKLAADRERLFQREEGGNTSRPIDVESAAIVEMRAEGIPCPRCEGEQRVLEHLAVTVSGHRLREARLQCRRCGSKRSMWFRIALLN
jgi:DNA-directed RNA polymerase subunit RPC12/RpoP